MPPDSRNLDSSAARACRRPERRRRRRSLALVVCAVLTGAAHTQEAAVDARAAWHPGAHFMQKVREQCASAVSGRYGECLIAQMPAAGAGAQAVAFSRRLYDATGQTAYLRAYRSVDRIGIGEVVYPLRANQNQGWLLLNGDPPLIDVDDPEVWPREGLAHDAHYTALLQAHPQLAIFPGDRSGPQEPRIEPLPEGGRRIVVRYRLLDGCHACAVLGTAGFGFDFDSAGQFVGPTLLGVDAARTP